MVCRHINRAAAQRWIWRSASSLRLPPCRKPCSPPPPACGLPACHASDAPARTAPLPTPCCSALSPAQVSLPQPRPPAVQVSSGPGREAAPAAHLVRHPAHWRRAAAAHAAAWCRAGGVGQEAASGALVGAARFGRHLRQSCWWCTSACWAWLLSVVRSPPDVLPSSTSSTTGVRGPACRHPGPRRRHAPDGRLGDEPAGHPPRAPHLRGRPAAPGQRAEHPGAGGLGDVCPGRARGVRGLGVGRAQRSSAA